MRTIGHTTTSTPLAKWRIGAAIALDVPMREPLVFRSESSFFGRHARRLPAPPAPVGWLPGL
jgi:hypothetical protein